MNISSHYARVITYKDAREETFAKYKGRINNIISNIEDNSLSDIDKVRLKNILI